MHLGFSLTPFGHHPAAWRGEATINAFRFDALLAQVAIAERSGLDFVLLADHLGAQPSDRLSPIAAPYEPTTLASALASRARRIGFLVAASTRQHEPYNLARRFASMDQVSGGRTGWAILGEPHENGRDQEYAALVSALWDSWEDDAFIYDKRNGRFFEPDKMHVLNHQGENFTVRGPLNVNRSPQGKPVLAHVLMAGTVPLAARHAEVIILQAADPAEAKTVISGLVRRLEQQGRQRADVRILANVIPYVAETHEQAQALHDRLQAAALKEEDASSMRGCTLIGTAAAIAGDLQGWRDAAPIDGFNILPPTIPAFETFLRDVIPALQRHAVLPGHRATLRQRLGLKRPAYPAGSLERAS